MTESNNAVVPAPIALVTGAARGLGRPVAVALARHGFDVVVTARDKDRLGGTVSAIQEHGRKAWAYALDLTDPEAPERLAQQLVDAGTMPDALVNNGGIGGPVGPLWELSTRDWEETFAVNVTGTFACCRAFLPAMLARQRGSIVIIGSATGKATLPGRTAYAASKLALVGLTRTLAAETGPGGVRVNLVSPANVEGERMDWVLESRAAGEGVPREEIARRMTAQSAMKRFVTPEEVANTVAFLASDSSSGITGEDINVSAGYVMY